MTGDNGPDEMQCQYGGSPGPFLGIWQRTTGRPKYFANGESDHLVFLYLKKSTVLQVLVLDLVDHQIERFAYASFPAKNKKKIYLPAFL